MVWTYKLIQRQWRLKWPMYWGMVPELLLCVAVLVLFGIQQPDVFRTKFWAIGHEYKMNSSPKLILYAYANHRPLPDIPFVWSQTLTNFNVAISVVSLFVLLFKMIATIMKVYYPVLGLIVNTSLVALYATSVYGQAGPDYLDPRYPSPVPWYIKHSCDMARPFNAVKDCQIAKGSFAATIMMLALYLAYFGLAVWAMWPNPELDIDYDSDDEMDDKTTGKSVEMQPTSGAPLATPAMPFTPRTQAFHTLDRRLPLRQG